MNIKPSTLKFGLPILLIVLGVGGFSYLKASRPEPPKPQPKEKVWQVEVFEASPQSLAPSLILYGEVEAPDLLQAAAPGAGLVTELWVRKGDKVRQGDALLRLDPRDFAPAVAQAEADVLDLEAQLSDLDLRHRSNQQALKKEQRLLKLAQAKVAREERLRKQNLSSESALDDARDDLGRQELSLIARQSEVQRHEANRKQLEARLLRAQARLDEAELALERSEVIAPFDGVVAAVGVAVGDRVQTAQVLLTLYPADGLEVRARIPVRYQAEIQEALNQDPQLNAHAELAGHSIRLNLDRLAGEADASGIDGFFGVIEGADRLRLGNLLKLDLRRPLQPGLVSIPFQAIYGNSRIYLLREGRMQGIEVQTVGQYRPVDAPPALLIRSPEIKAGDRIIRTHLPHAVSGLKVKVAKG
ncbi:MAG: biotin/lipoyl-binding protein [Gammaproteobacteria bacterium]|nr:biotin/lipoyl-binding protein [Gammaproteobacteria bacterium]